MEGGLASLRDKEGTIPLSSSLRWLMNMVGGCGFTIRGCGSLISGCGFSISCHCLISGGVFVMAS